MCSLTEAFQSFVDPASRNDNLLGETLNEPAQGGYDFSEKKKRKKRRAPMPPTEEVIEPDRPAHRRMSPGEVLTGQPEENEESTSNSEMLNAFESSEYFPSPSIDAGSKNPYMLEPDWATAFNDTSAPSWIKDRMPRKEAEAPLVPSPWMDGAPTLWKKVPEEQVRQVALEKIEQKENSKLDALQRKFDSMFKKLEDLESSRSESQHLEIILFVLGGIFIILLLDLLVKQGTQAMVMLGNVGATVGGNHMGGFLL